MKLRLQSIALCVLFTLLWAMPAFGQQERNVGILPFHNTNGSDSWIGKGIEEYLYDKLNGISSLSVYERETLERILVRSKISSAKDVDTKTAFSVGKSTGIEVLFGGDFAQSGDNLTINFRIISTYTGAPILETILDGSTSNLFTNLSTGIRKGMEIMQLPLLAGEEQWLSSKPTNSIKAFEYYCDAYLEIDRKTPVEAVTGMFQRALMEDPNFLDAQYNLGVIYYNSRWYDKAQQQFDEIIQKNPRYYKAHFGKGVIAYLQKNNTLASQYFNKTLQLNPDFDRCYYYLGTVYTKSDSLKKGIQILEQSIEMNPNYAPAHYQLGVAEMERGWFKRAISALTKATQLDPEFYLANNKLGEAYYAINYFEEAIIEFRKAIKMRSSFATAYFNLGNAIYRRGALAEIVDAFWSLLEVQYGQVSSAEPDLATPIQGLEGLRARSREVGDEKTIQRQMVGAYRTALSFDKRFYEASYNLALTYENLSMPDSSEYYYKLAIDQKPDLAQAHMRLGKLYESQKKYRQALIEFKEVVRHEPDYFATNPKLGEEYRYINIVELVLEENMNILDKNPTNQDALEVVGKIYLSLGRLGQAEQYYEKLLTVNPDDPLAQKTLNQIRRQLRKM